jgi:hypothetical protein
LGVNIAGRFALVVSVLLAACGTQEPPGEVTPPKLTEPLRTYDVSILMPLPDAPQRLSLIGPDETGPLGELLPRRLYADLPQLEKFVENVQMYDLLRVVGIRLDPCFPTLDPSKPEGCTSMVRLVMQPIKLVTIDDRLALSATDLAVHLFYAVDEPELEELAAWLADARARSVPDAEPGPLAVHPALAKEGVDGAFMTTLKGKLMSAIGEQNLTRVTVMTLGDFGNVWTFEGFDVTGDALKPFAIPTIPQTSQKVTNTDSTGKAFVSGKLEPPKEPTDDVSFWLESEAVMGATPAAQAQAFATLVRIENPTMQNPDTIDCASCHVAPAARHWATGVLGLEPAATDEYRDPSGQPVAGATLARTDELRMFGYFDTRPSISQRTVNETDALVRFWNAKLGLD